MPRCRIKVNTIEWTFCIDNFIHNNASLPPKMKDFHASDLILSIRALIVGYHLRFSCGWIEISQKLRCRPDTAQKFYERTLELAGSPDLHQMLENIAPLD